MASRILNLSLLFALAAGATPAATPTPTVAPTRAPFVAGYENGFVLQSETGDFTLKLSGYVQADGRFLCRR